MLLQLALFLFFFMVSCFSCAFSFLLSVYFWRSVCLDLALFDWVVCVFFFFFELHELFVCSRD